MVNLTLKDAVTIATANNSNAVVGIEQGVRNDDLNSLSNERKEELIAAFSRMLDPLLKLDAALKGVNIEARNGLSEGEQTAYKEASDYLCKEAPSVITSLGIEKAFLAMKANKFTVHEPTLITAVAKILSDVLVNTGSSFEINTSLFKIGFIQTSKLKTTFDTDKIRELAGYQASITTTNSILADCFSQPSAKIIDKAVNVHVSAGDLPNNVISLTDTLGLAISVSRKEEE